MSQDHLNHHTNRNYSHSYSQGGSLIVCQKAFQPSGGKLVSILFDISGLPRNVGLCLTLTYGDSAHVLILQDVETVAITSFNAIGEDLGDFKTNPAQVETQVRYQKIVSKLLRHGSLKVRHTMNRQSYL